MTIGLDTGSCILWTIMASAIGPETSPADALLTILQAASFDFAAQAFIWSVSGTCPACTNLFATMLSSKSPDAW